MGCTNIHQPYHPGVVFVLLPGFSQTASVWDEVGSHLTGSWKALETPRCDSWRATVDSIALAGGRGTYVGYSMGGRLALGVALAYPELVERLVMMSAGPGIDDASERIRRRATDREWIETIRTSGSEGFLERWLSQEMFADLGPRATDHRIGDADHLVDQVRTLGQGAMPAYHDRLGELTMPVSLLVGERDIRYRQIASRTADLIGPGAEVRIVQGAGHSVIAEAPETVAFLLET